MDDNTIMAAVSIAMAIVSLVGAAVNHRRIRSNCCGRMLTASIDIEATTPPHPPDLSIAIPTQSLVKQ